jgi:hypothetical protein
MMHLWKVSRGVVVVVVVAEEVWRTAYIFAILRCVVTFRLSYPVFRSIEKRVAPVFSFAVFLSYDACMNSRKYLPIVVS